MPGFDFAPARRPRRLGLTPLIDVVFLLLVFFMLAARFAPERGVPLVTGGAGGDWQGPPRLVEVGAAGLRLNGRPTPSGALGAALRPLMPAPDSPVVLRPDGSASVQDLADALEALAAAGIAVPIVVP
jgi:biopolymer transport protein ExbD